MAPHEHDRKKKTHHQESRRALNTPENALKAVSAARACIGSLAAGKVWKHRAPHGIEIKGALTIDGSAVVILHFSPEDGSVLPKGLHGFSEGTPELISDIESRLSDYPERLIVLEGAEFREPEFCWAIPLVCDGRIVAHLKVSSDGSEIMPDKKAMEEIQSLIRRDES
ncbi:hypothetical protein KF728_21030 [Candidatus Obscuribacterales bacterium]|nr:hypothetical protein [Candidatus Obscuribacterales bacterium]MBX3152654.1 hypothetical protein [Candidatus Obscuribacterales bacterium]